VQCPEVVHKHCSVVLPEGGSFGWHALYRLLETKAIGCAQVTSVFLALDLWRSSGVWLFGDSFYSSS
jgi:hypothetical protein